MEKKLTAKEILAKYERKLESELGSSGRESKEYTSFKEEMIYESSRYERWAQSLGSLIKFKVKETDRIKIQKQLDAAHVRVSPSQALTLSLFSLLSIFFFTILIALGVYLINGTFPLLFVFLGLLTSMFVFYYTFSMPKRLANAWRLKASAQMVPAILYTVVYMKHTSNLERAIEFASQHLEGPLALDFKKIFYNVEIGKYSTIKQSLDDYLESWRDYAPEFIEAFHLIESSLFEPTETRRILILEKSLQVILDGVYEKMLKYSREIRTPLTNVYMLGIILPTLGLALLPLASTLLGGILKWTHVLIIFNILIPFFVFYLASEALLKRPGGYGETSILELNPLYPEYASKKPWIAAALIAIPILLIGLLPFIFQINFLTSAFGIQSDYTFEQIGISFLGDAKLFDFKIVAGNTIGPFGSLASLLSLFIPLSIALFFAISYKLKTKELIKSRESTEKLESEFSNTLFQFGNRLGDGLPAEVVFGKVAASTQGQATHDFFSLVNRNIQQAGMSLESAIFDKRRGAIIYFPSQLISTSMKILVESVKKGLRVAAESLMSISQYLKNIDKINQRLRDLLAEIVSDMRSNMTFLAPLLSGIVTGLAVMITAILNKLSELQTSGTLQQSSTFGSIPQIFEITEMIPPYFLQIIIGIYIVEIIFILTSALVTVNSGKDPLQEKYQLSRNLIRGTALYLITALISIIALTLLATIAIAGI